MQVGLGAGVAALAAMLVFWCVVVAIPGIAATCAASLVTTTAQ